MTQPTTGFSSFNLAEPILAAVHAAGFTEPTPVQAASIAPALEGRDLMVSAETGSGKTAAFLLPALHKLTLNKPAGGDKTRAQRGEPRVLILTPTRELAQQIEKQTQLFGRNLKWLKIATMLGGMPYHVQMKALRGGLDVMIATPGRLLDHIQSGKLDLSTVETLILDEADRMLDMGFIEDIEAICAATPATRQTVMFSATFAGRLATLARDMLRDPQRIELNSQRDQHASITQHLHWADDESHKNALLTHWLTRDNLDQAIVFTSTQEDADWLAGALEERGHATAALHGGLPQPKRNRILQNLRSGRVRVLVATDVAARGIDVPTISHVINYGLPMNAEDYVHRIGRTGRAGRAGTAITLALADDKFKIRRIERFTSRPIPAAVVEGLEPQRPAPGFKDGRPGQRRDRPYGDRPQRAYGDRPQRAYGDRPQHAQGDRPARPWDGERAARSDAQGAWSKPAPAWRKDERGGAGEYRQPREQRSEGRGGFGGPARGGFAAEGRAPVGSDTRAPRDTWAPRGPGRGDARFGAQADQRADRGADSRAPREPRGESRAYGQMPGFGDARRPARPASAEARGSRQGHRGFNDAGAFARFSKGD
jgi:superfamily II DNA/RNA helicase